MHHAPTARHRKERKQCNTIVPRLLGQHCPEPGPSRRNTSCRGSKVTTALDGEHAVYGGGGTARAPCHLQSRQAERAGPRGPETSGIKAGWPRLGTRRGAQTANPTAVRRDAAPRSESEALPPPRGKPPARPNAGALSDHLQLGKTRMQAYITRARRPIAPTPLPVAIMPEAFHAVRRIKRGRFAYATA
jgi:hypothetical protein